MIFAVQLLLAGGSACGQDGAAGAGMPKFQIQTYQLECAQPRYPMAGRHYEISGQVVIGLRLNQDGVEHARVAGSSGWKFLDDAVLESALSTCRRTPGAQPVDKELLLPYVMQMDGRSLRPTLVPGSCQPHGRFTTFTPLRAQLGDQSGLMVRMLIGPDGVPTKVWAEANGQPAAMVRDAIAFTATCRFQHADVPEHARPIWGRALVGTE